MVGDHDDFDPIARAEAALASLQDGFADWVQADVDRLHAGLEALRGDAADVAARRVLFSTAHDIKGQGATFGYPLLSEIGQRLCRLLEEAGPLDVERVAAHVTALAGVLAGRLTGDGGGAGREWLASLE
jgi:hypothetical protein